MSSSANSSPEQPPEDFDELQYYKDRTENLQSRVEYLENCLENLSFEQYPETRQLLSPDNFKKINDMVGDMIIENNREFIFDQIVEGVSEIFGFERTSLMKREGDKLTVVESRGLPQDYVDDLEIEIGDRPGKEMREVIGRAAHNGETIVIKDRSNSPRFNRRSQEEGKTFSMQFLVIPLLTFEETAGILTVAVDEESDIYLSERTVKVLQFFANQCTIALENIQMRERREKMFENMIYSLGEAIETRDSTTGEHVSRLQDYALRMAEKLDLDGEQKQSLKYGALLHDIGKIGIEDEILLKPSDLTEAEFEKIKKHPRFGSEIISHLEFLGGVQEIVQYHHERWDGGGYPEGLAGDEIPLLARIISIIDAFDVMTHQRPYREPMEKHEAVAELINCSGSQFDPHLVDEFLDLLPPETVEKARRNL